MLTQGAVDAHTMREEWGGGGAVEALCTLLLEFPINCIIHVITKGYRPVGLVNLCPSDRLCLSDLLLLDSASTAHTVMIAKPLRDQRVGFVRRHSPNLYRERPSSLHRNYSAEPPGSVKDN